MKYLSVFIGIFLCLLLTPISVLADEAGSDKLANALERYQKTGTVENCINLRSNTNNTVIDDQHILFKMIGSKAYLNTLPRPCPRLGFEKAFTYKTSANLLCNLDIINVYVAGASIPGPSCGLGKFEEYERVAKEEQ